MATLLSGQLFDFGEDAVGVDALVEHVFAEAAFAGFADAEVGVFGGEAAFEEPGAVAATESCAGVLAFHHEAEAVVHKIKAAVNPPLDGLVRVEHTATDYRLAAVGRLGQINPIDRRRRRLRLCRLAGV